MKKVVSTLGKFLGVVAISAIFNAMPSLAVAGTQMFDFKLVEQTANGQAGREGRMKVYVAGAGEHGPRISTLQQDALYQSLDLGLWVETVWNNKGTCNDPAFAGGGQQDGWLLGAITDKSFMESSKRPEAVVAYGVLTGTFGDSGKAVDYSCDNVNNNELESSTWLLFVRPASTYNAKYGYWVADGWYADGTEEGVWYSLYNDKPF